MSKHVVGGNEETVHEPKQVNKRKRIALVAGVLIGVGLVGGYVTENFSTLSTSFISFLSEQRDKMGMTPESKVVVPAPIVRVDKITKGTVQEIEPVSNTYYTYKLVVQDDNGRSYNVGATEDDLAHIVKGTAVHIGLQLATDKTNLVEDTILLSDDGTVIHRNAVSKTP